MEELGLLVEKAAIVDTLTDLFVGTDRRDWPAVQECFAPQVLFDMSSFTGTPASTIAAEEIVSGWEQGLASVAGVHHQAGNFKVHVAGDEAEASCYAIASHYLPNASGRNTRLFFGSYDFRLAKDGERWRITLFRFNFKYADGSPELERPSAAGTAGLREERAEH